MPRTILPSEDCVLRLDSENGYRSEFPVTFNDVGLSEDGFEFNGSSSYIKIINDARLNFGASGDFTIECLFTPYTVGDRMCIVDKSDLSSITGGYSVELSTAEDIRLSYYDGAVPSPSVKSDATVLLEIPIHVVFVWDAGDSTLRKLYLNGVLDNSTISETNSGIDSDYNLYIGARASSEDFNFDGSIKNLSIYNRALTAQEALDRYNKVTFRVE